MYKTEAIALNISQKKDVEMCIFCFFQSVNNQTMFPLKRKFIASYIYIKENRFLYTELCKNYT